MGILDAPHLADGASDRSVRPRSPVGGVMSRSCAGFRAREPARDHVGRLRRLAERRLGGSLPARASAGAAPAEVGAPTARTSSFPCVAGPKRGWGWRPEVIGRAPSQRLTFCAGTDSAQENIHILSGRDGVKGQGARAANLRPGSTKARLPASTPFSSPPPVGPVWQGAPS
ncbi:gem-associated protein 7 isoform X1 [Rousettus aegyptiacus]|uniref:gem-associated protein 7 isoform X1 n=1 Tax=Rousettus aegyptiacus TaxID=9407 RepID=UPI00168D85E2|nr:gem-associated protein 7 isoform X1 [Rousettus aegyptiacus]